MRQEIRAGIARFSGSLPLKAKAVGQIAKWVEKMKNKKMTYLLLIVVLGIWGIIFYKIYMSIKSSDKLTVRDYSMLNKNDSNLYKIDTFSIVNNYRDPFITSKMATYENKSKVGHHMVAQKPIVSQNAQIKWPTIAYNGMIKSKKSSQQLVLVKINGTSDFMTKGSSFSGVQLLRVYKDSIEVGYSGEKKSIRK
jgi:hypothetical protein